MKKTPMQELIEKHGGPVPFAELSGHKLRSVYNWAHGKACTTGTYQNARDAIRYREIIKQGTED